MAVLLSLIFTLFLLAIGFVCFCIPMLLTWLVIDRLALARFRKRLRIGLPAILIPSLYALLIVLLFLWFTRPAAVFEMAFQFPPTPDVVISSASHSGIGDFGESEILFVADRSTVNTIVHQQFNTTIEASTPDDDGTFRFARDYSEFFASETEKLEYNPDTSETHYTWQGID